MCIRDSAQVVAAYRAGMEVNDICWRVEHTLVEKGYDPDDMPSANTPEYDKMRCDLAYSIWDSEKAYVVQYYDGQENWVTMRSPLLLYGKNADADIDISNFAEQDIREMREAVSYTHLDVYKRQATDSAAVRRRALRA